MTGSDFDRMAAAGVGSLRMGITWPSVQASADAPFDFSAVDPTVAEAARHRISLLPTLLGTPGFVQPSCVSAACAKRLPVQTPEQRAGWRRFVRAVAARYGPRGSFWRAHPSLPAEPIEQWEIWNEQNNPAQGNPPRAYAKLLALSDRALESVDPKAEVVVGGMFGTPTGSVHRGVTAWSYLDRVYAAGAGDHFAAVAVHPYAPNVAGIAYQIRRVRTVMDRNGDDSKPIIVDEIGWGSGGQQREPGTGSRGQVFVVSPREQRRKLIAAYTMLTNERDSWHIGGVYWFTWKDPLNPPPGLCAFCYSSGLYGPDGTSAKPALSALERFTKNRSPSE